MVTVRSNYNGWLEECLPGWIPLCGSATGCVSNIDVSLYHAGVDVSAGPLYTYIAVSLPHRATMPSRLGFAMGRQVKVPRQRSTPILQVSQVKTLKECLSRTWHDRKRLEFKPQICAPNSSTVPFFLYTPANSSQPCAISGSLHVTERGALYNEKVLRRQSVFFFFSRKKLKRGWQGLLNILLSWVCQRVTNALVTARFWTISCVCFCKCLRSVLNTM